MTSPVQLRRVAQSHDLYCSVLCFCFVSLQSSSLLSFYLPSNFLFFPFFQFCSVLSSLHPFVPTLLASYFFHPFFLSSLFYLRARMLTYLPFSSSFPSHLLYFIPYFLLTSFPSFLLSCPYS